MVFFLSILPIVLLIYLMVKRNSLPSYIALPLIAVLTYLLQAFYFGTDLTRLNANVIAKTSNACQYHDYPQWCPLNWRVHS